MPRQAVLVFEPAALLRFFIAARAELLPVIINFFLRLTIDLQRDGFVEFEDGATIQRGEGLPV